MKFKNIINYYIYIYIYINYYYIYIYIIYYEINQIKLLNFKNNYLINFNYKL